MPLDYVHICVRGSVRSLRQKKEGKIVRYFLSSQIGAVGVSHVMLLFSVPRCESSRTCNVHCRLLLITYHSAKTDQCSAQCRGWSMTDSLPESCSAPEVRHEAEHCSRLAAAFLQVCTFLKNLLIKISQSKTCSDKTSQFSN